MNSKKNYERAFKMAFSTVYPLYVEKVGRKGRTAEELDTVLRWLTGYSQEQLMAAAHDDTSLRDFFEQAPRMHPNTTLIKGVICGVRVEEIEDATMQKIRWLDKLVDELAKGKKMESILRS